MRQRIIGLVGLMLLAGQVMAAEPAVKSAVESLSGVVVDNTCATANKDTLAEFVKTHTKDCALMPSCQASGYSLYLPDGQLLTFDKASDAKIVRFLKGKKSTLNVNVKIERQGNELKLISIKNRG